jgi:hypothetical protein
MKFYTCSRDGAGTCNNGASMKSPRRTGVVGRVIACCVPVVLVSTLVLMPVSIAADSPAPVVVSLTGPAKVRALIAEGNTMPCDSPENHVLYNGFIEPDQILRLAATNGCVCYQQSFAPLTAVDWGPAQSACSPVICKHGPTGKNICTPSPDRTIRIGLTSRRTPGQN